MEIKKITAEESYIVRHPVLRSGRPIQDCAFEYDDHPSSIHLGLEVEGKVISVISALPIRCENFPKLVAMRLRGIATLESYQRQGYGTQLINGIEKRLLKNKGIKLIWLNARINASDFYRKMGYKTIGNHFNIKGIGTHQQFFKMINR
jgi:GNAT superfamily N-acetyltransferase